MKYLIIATIILMLSSCEKYHKFCYVVHHKHMTYSKYGYPYYYLYVKNDSISEEKSVSASTYYQSNIGSTVCFNEQTSDNLGLFFISIMTILVIIILFLIILLIWGCLIKLGILKD